MSDHTHRMIDNEIPARDVRVGDDIVTTTYAGQVSQVDTFDLNSGVVVPPSSWPCLRLLVEGQGGVARFPHELVVTSGSRECSDADCGGNS